MGNCVAWSFDLTSAAPWGVSLRLLELRAEVGLRGILKKLKLDCLTAFKKCALECCKFDLFKGRFLNGHRMEKTPGNENRNKVNQNTQASFEYNAAAFINRPSTSVTNDNVSVFEMVNFQRA